MKYIRTKNHFLGFYKEMSISLNGWVKGKYYHDVVDRRLHRLGAGLLLEKNIEKQANTIEELCDEWVIIPIGPICNPFVRNIKDNISHFMNNSHIIYSAIYTEKGLIYVAELNKNGELELL